MTAVITWVLVLFLLASDEEPGGAFQGGPWMFAGLKEPQQCDYNYQKVPLFA